MTENSAKTVYKLLSDDDRQAVRDRLQFHHHFYHGTPKRCLPSIKAKGLSPSFEGMESEYPVHERLKLEPAEALRYCIRCKPQGAISAARTRARVWDKYLEIDIPDPAGIAVLRAPAASLLNRCFGLDHSGLSGSVACDANDILKSHGRFTAEQFIDLVVRSGAISCYEIIPPEELDVCSDEHPTERTIMHGSFVPLLMLRPEAA